MTRLISTEQVIEILGVSRSTLARWIRAGEFVPKTHLGCRIVRFAEADVEAWLASRAPAERRRGDTRGDERL